MDKKPVLVMPTTHWDRAWYWTFQRFRVRLIDLIQAMLTQFRLHPDYRFVMDGQTVPLEDYLEACPEDRKEIEQLVKSGRLQLGPMYTLPDHYCTGGESLIRNLLTGSELVRQLGGTPPRMLYLPDSFGFPADLPTVAAGAGFQQISFMRGTSGCVPHELRMFIWEGSDGSPVQVFRLRDGYANAAHLGSALPGRIQWAYDHEKAVERLIAAATQQDDAQGSPRLLLAGVDHMIPQPQLDQAMKDATARSGFNFTYAVLDDLASGVEKKESGDWLRYRGEFRGTGCSHILGGTVSTRIHLKQTNADVERLLTHVAEPADAHCALLGRLDSTGSVLRTAWKHLLKTHPHDDITGCSVDKVHEDDEYQMDEAFDAADAVRRRMSDVLQHRFGGRREGDRRYGFILVNQQPFRRLCQARITMDFEGFEKWGDAPPPEFYAVVDEAGREIPFVELRRGRSIEHPHRFAEIELMTELDPFAPIRFFMEPREVWPLTAMTPDMLENDLVRIDVHGNGSFDVTDKVTGQVLRHAGLFSDQGDCGDSYDFSDIADDTERIFDGIHFERKILPGCSGCQCMELRGTLPVPEDSDRYGRSGKTVDLPVTIRLTLFRGDRELRINMIMLNTAKSHRLRWNLELPFRTDHTRAGQKFCEVRHEVRPQPPPAAACSTQDNGAFNAAEMGQELKEFRVHPEFTADQFIAAENAQGGAALLIGLPVNYEVVDNGESQRLAVCVLRSIGLLSRRRNEMNTRPTMAGPDTPVPGAQLIGRQINLSFGLRLFASAESGGVLRAAFLDRAIAFHGQISPRAPAWDGQTAAPAVQCNNDALMLSALKVSHDRKHIVVRLLNPTDCAQTGILKIAGARQLVPCLHTERIEEGAAPVKRARGGFAIEVPPMGLNSYLVRIKKPEYRYDYEYGLTLPV
ncbi:MAG: hypothetical protein HOO88_07260 [Kiritimatiellaceae bacterium]|nr:hypothetical protein [Kiritimatiellaceae bacterium]